MEVGGKTGLSCRSASAAPTFPSGLCASLMFKGDSASDFPKKLFKISSDDLLPVLLVSKGEWKSNIPKNNETFLCR